VSFVESDLHSCIFLSNHHSTKQFTFHGAYAAALAEGLPLPERVRRAGAAAALKATRPGGQSGTPDRAALETFLRAIQHAPRED
ncbi:MAG: hypothetical protein NTW87_24975, partial [Planctomycetota bacterium]|nr:hypothetical protein [Planctomycetota bacterium]